ncbi:MAG TPA: plastocyanin/azurin family copper-binding protein [Gaiellaceae bacterium]|nr:plastocyanin/azurin family copper-binding protein [Gaiellaceae bacterium]
MLVVAGLATSHKIGLSIVAAVFIAFALVSSFVVPRRRPDYPGKAGMSVFVIASLVLFVAMISAIEVFGAEGDAHAGETPAAAQAAAPQATFQVQEKEFSITLPSAAAQTLKPGTYAFVVHNVGTVAHDLKVTGPGVPATAQTALIQPGNQATLTVTLAAGSYTLYCTVPGHRAAGMVTTLTVA